MSNRPILSLVREALVQAHLRHNVLGEKGLEELPQGNQFGEKALVGDFECEEAVINCFLQERISMRFFTEEHGVVNLGRNPKFLAVLDGIDGTSLYKKSRGVGEYGTMLGIFSGINPSYKNYLCGGIIQHARHRLFLYQKGCGATISAMSRNLVPIKTSPWEALGNSVILVDEWFEINKQTFSGPLKDFNVSCLDCSSLHYARVAEGLANLALECTRKGNLELAIAYGLIAEAGGVMVDLQGNDMGPRKYLEFGQGKDEHIPIITAGSKRLADNLRHFLDTRSK